MAKENVGVAVNEILKNNVEFIVPFEEIKPEDDLTKLGLNSINFIRVVVSVEKEFGFSFDDSSLDYRRFKTIGSLISFIEDQSCI